MEHSPLPFRLEDDEDDDQPVLNMRSSKDSFVAEFRSYPEAGGRNEVSRAQTQTDAAFILRACNNFERVEQTLANLLSVQPHEGTKDAMLRDAIADARAALAEARK